MTRDSPLRINSPSAFLTTVSRTIARVDSDLCLTVAITMIRSPTYTGRKNRVFWLSQSTPAPGRSIPGIREMKAFRSMPWTTRPANPRTRAKPSSMCSGFRSPDRRAKSSTSSAVISCSQVAVVPTAIESKVRAAIVQSATPWLRG